MEILIFELNNMQGQKYQYGTIIQSIHRVKSKSIIYCTHTIQQAGTARRNSAVRPRQANIARGDLSSPNELNSDMCSIYYTYRHKNNMRQTKITRRCLS